MIGIFYWIIEWMRLERSSLAALVTERCARKTKDIEEKTQKIAHGTSLNTPSLSQIMILPLLTLILSDTNW